MLVAAGAMAALAEAGWVATTTPFTATADLAVAVGFAGMAVLAARALVLRHRVGRPAPPSGSALPWVVAIVLLVALELAAYFAGSGHRQAYPTLSSLYDSAARVTGVKALFVLAWLGLGWGLFRR